ncbi:MAG: Smr/MutS family protein [Deltaproteobacteria bacterium]|nr:Smr/MutS family protein [Deltaproteobacteria bacterium]MBF0526178.1 Smr/MutS family protein [Deltaproteobacteria bacterium]
MATKKRRTKKKDRPEQKVAPPVEPAFNAPFANLHNIIKKQPKVEAIPPPAPRPVPLPPPVDDRERQMFVESMAGVVPIDHDDKIPSQGKKNKCREVHPKPLSREDADVLAFMSDLVSGRGRLDYSFSDEYMEWSDPELNPSIMKSLRDGDLAIQAHLDLHRQTAEEARLNVENFVISAYNRGLRCVLIIHGRGRNSKENTPVLKQLVRNWLTRGKIKKMVLGFASAQPYDGGPGAIYVLLRTYD